jgi:hypothetical protein
VSNIPFYVNIETKKRIMIIIFQLFSVSLIIFVIIFDYFWGSHEFGIAGASIISFSILYILFSIRIFNDNDFIEKIYIFISNQIINKKLVYFLIFYIAGVFILPFFSFDEELWKFFAQIPIFPYLVIHLLLGYLVYEVFAVLIGLIVGIPLSIWIWYELIISFFLSPEKKILMINKIKKKISKESQQNQKLMDALLITDSIFQEELKNFNKLNIITQNIFRLQEKIMKTEDNNISVEKNDNEIVELKKKQDIYRKDYVQSLINSKVSYMSFLSIKRQQKLITIKKFFGKKDEES